MQDRKLYRRRNDKVLMGLAGGIADYFKIDATVVRVLCIILEFATAGLLIIGYFIVALFVPKEPVTANNG
ncbi:MAG: PspC domain-containing protein [Candidatus Saccharimonadales bacterium]